MAKTAKKAAASGKASETDTSVSAETAPVKAKTRSRGSSAAASGKKLVVVESPAKAKTINKYLGDEYIVKASMGHVRDLPEKNIGVDVEHDFAPSYEPLSGRRKVLAELKKIAKTSPEIFLATDLDREGEAIAWHLAESLGVDNERFRRVVFNEITAGAIREAFSHPRSIDMDKVNAQQARRILDRIVGYQVSPLLWRKVATGLSAGRVQTVAVRLIVEREREIEKFQPEEYWRITAIFTPELSAAEKLAKDWPTFLAQRDEKDNPPTREQQQEFLFGHRSFRAELVTYKGEKFQTDAADAAVEIARAMGLNVREVLRTTDETGKGRAKNRVVVLGDIAPQAGKFLVRSLAQRESRSRPPAPFTTASLQQAASSQLRFAASRTMRIAQGLYEGVDVPGEGSVGLITYMRTDSTHLSAEALSHVRKLIADRFGQKYVPEKPNFFSSSERAQEAHEAIRPTDASRRPEELKNALTEEQYRLYDLIWTRFVACQMPPAVWNVTEADIVSPLESGEAVFKAIGRQLAFDGFYRVAGVPRGGEQILPELKENQPLYPVELSPSQHFTQPPPRFTEASLVKAMEAEGIGRPSTYASIIQTIQDRNYVRLNDRAFSPTDLGVVVTDKLVKHFQNVFDVRFTAHMESQLDKVEEEHADWVKILHEFYKPFQNDLSAAAENMTHAKSETQPSEYACETCGKPMVYRFSKNGRYLACTGYPDCKSTHPVDAQGKKVEKIFVPAPCPICGKPQMVLRRSRFGPFLGCADYPKCTGTLPCDKDGNPLKVVKPEDIHETCSVCGAPMAVKFKGRRPFLGCTKYPDCKNATGMPEGVRVAAPPREKPEEAGVNCPKCGKPMVIRTGRRGKFLACSGYPRCRNAMDLSELETLKAQPQKQPEKKQKKTRTPTPPAES
jgi:DNA topoisomerase-1